MVLPGLMIIMTKKKNPTQKRDLSEAEAAEELAVLTDRILAGEDISPEELKDFGVEATTLQRLQAAANVEPDPAFAIRTRNLALAALPRRKETVSERLQAVIHRLMGDETFRTDFFAAPESTLQQAGFQLSPAEIAALKEMEPENLEEWMSDLDERISKSGLL